jgi:hypothetical protein
VTFVGPAVLDFEFPVEQFRALEQILQIVNGTQLERTFRLEQSTRLKNGKRNSTKDAKHTQTNVHT